MHHTASIGCVQGARKDHAMTHTRPAAPPEIFNIAAQVLAANAGRAQKAAFIDELGALSYGQLDQRARQLAAPDRVCGRAAEDGHRQDPARQAARA
jgi:non-ribosomal peptide synthetase component F